MKETYNTLGNPLPINAQFTFLLDGGRTTKNTSDGYARFDGVTPGTHTVTEIIPPTWMLLNVTPANGQVYVPTGGGCAGIVFKNKQVLGSSSSSSYQHASSVSSVEYASSCGWWGSCSTSSSSSVSSSVHASSISSSSTYSHASYSSSVCSSWYGCWY